MAQADWKTLNGISFSFQNHCNPQYSNAAKVLAHAYSNFIIGNDFDSLFIDDKKTDLKPDAFPLLKELIKQSMTNDAINTDPAYRTTFITRFVDSAPFTFSLLGTNRICNFRTLDQFKMLLNEACQNYGSSNYHAFIELGIDDLYFAHAFRP